MSRSAGTAPRRKRIAIIAVAAIAVIVVAVLGAYHYASRLIEERVLQALGPESRVAEVKVRLTDVELTGIDVKAPAGWPSQYVLRAGRVVLTPKLRHIFSDRIELTSVRVENAYISAVRPKGGGGLRLLPNLEKRAKQDTGDRRRGAAIGTVRLEQCTIELYDATVALKPQRVRIDAVSGTIRDVQVPDLSARTDIDLEGAIKGPKHAGTIGVRGWVDAGRKSAEIELKVRNVDLALFEPYLVRKTKAGIESGTFNLDLKSSVRNNVVHAPGTLSVSKLKLQQSENPIGAIASIPRRAAIGALSDESDQITVPFNLDGNLDDPTFSLAGEGALKTGVAVAKAFGMSFEGLVHAFFIIVNGIGSAFGSAL